MSAALPANRPPHPNIPWAVFWILGYIGFTQIPAAILAVAWLLILMLVAPPTDAELREAQTSPLGLPGMGSGLAVGLALAQVLSWAYSLVLLRVLVGRDWYSTLGLDRVPKAADLVAACALVPGMLIVGNSMVALLPGAPPPTEAVLGRETMAQFEKMIRAWPWWAAVLIIGVGPAIGEELFCRGFLGRGLVAWHGTRIGVLTTSLLFGIMHLIPAQAAYAAVLGVILHVLALSGRSLWLPMIAHFLNNGLSVMASCDDSPLKPWLAAAQQAVEARPMIFLPVGLGICAAIMHRLLADKTGGFPTDSRG